MRTAFAVAALTAVVLLGSQRLSFAQWSENKVTVRGMFGDRAMGDTFKPRPSKFGGTLERGPSGNFLGRTPDAQARMFNPASAVTRYRSAVVAAAPLAQPAAQPEFPLEYQPPLPLPEVQGYQPFEPAPSEAAPPRSDVWMRSPPSMGDGESAAPGPQGAPPASLGPAPGSGARRALPLTSQYAVGFDGNVPRQIRQVSQGGYSASIVAARLQKTLGNRARSRISVSIIDGTATVRGQVATQHDRHLVGYLVMFEPGIRQVNNEVSTEVPGLLTGGPGR